MNLLRKVYNIYNQSATMFPSLSSHIRQRLQQNDDITEVVVGTLTLYLLTLNFLEEEDPNRWSNCQRECQKCSKVGRGKPENFLRGRDYRNFGLIHRVKF